jgi:diaminohydroxyphosphoribosylaminopyrimidine deaminase / 5-amino-6-(5-phosphoribosylamino)uracil reductase
MSESDEKYMRRCLELARRGYGYVNPNPMVGAVVVKDGRIVGEGFHSRFGGDHAEIAALKQAGGAARGAILYVNLEPCNHHGKTPPCTHAIREAGIERVVYAADDPNPSVIGGGGNMLNENGVRTERGVLRGEAVTLNERFYFASRARLPFVVLKAAATLDGYIADAGSNSKWISGETSRAEVQSLRRSMDAVLVGAGTVGTDNPRLTVRGNVLRQPKRIILDGRLTAPLESRVYTDAYREGTIVVTSDSRKLDGKVRTLENRGVTVYRFKTVRGAVPIRRLLRRLWKESVHAILVEGGGIVFRQFVDLQLYAKLHWYIAPKLLGGGMPAVGGIERSLRGAFRIENAVCRMAGGDMVIEGNSKLYARHVY